MHFPTRPVGLNSLQKFHMTNLIFVKRFRYYVSEAFSHFVIFFSCFVNEKWIVRDICINISITSGEIDDHEKNCRQNRPILYMRRNCRTRRYPLASVRIGKKDIHHNSRHSLSDPSLEQAVINNRLIRNPLRGVKLPSVTRKEIDILSVEEQALLHSAASSSAELPAFGIIFTLSAGVRLGGLVGFQWGDINVKTAPSGSGELLAVFRK